MFEHDVRCGLQLAQKFNNRIPFEWYDIPPNHALRGWMDGLGLPCLKKIGFFLDKSYPIIDFFKVSPLF